MSERRFTRLKASLKDAKETRDRVSREFRQSVTSDDLADDVKRLSLTSLSSTHSAENVPTVQRIRDILKARHRIRTEANRPYENCELRLFLANSYAHSSWSLRRTWIENLAEVHQKNCDWSEYAMCLCHVISIVLRQLKTKGLDLLDAEEVLSRISPDLAIVDIPVDDDWLETEDSHVTLESLEELIDECARALDTCQLWELAVHVLKVLSSFHERHFQHKKLITIHETIAKMHSRALEANESGKRLFDTYFRVVVSGQNSEFIYKEPKVVSLAEMTSRLEKLYPNAILLSDCDDVTRPDALIVTHVNPFRERASLNEFERHVTINRFVYEQRLDSGSGQGVECQRKRRVILTTDKFFPYCLKRVKIISREELILSPLECAEDEMRSRVQQLEKVLNKKNSKYLQLVLQGSVQCQVNAGPQAYIKAFLHNPTDQRERELRTLFDQFLTLCELALKENEKLISRDQMEYHVSLKTSFERLKALLLMDNKRSSVQIFDAISGSSIA